jgi:hypothetical protein
MHCGCVNSRLRRFPLKRFARSLMGNPWKTLRVSHRLPTGRRLPTSSTALRLQSFKSGNVKTISSAPALAYSSPVAVQTTGTTAFVGPYVAFLILTLRPTSFQDVPS